MVRMHPGHCLSGTSPPGFASSKTMRAVVVGARSRRVTCRRARASRGRSRRRRRRRRGSSESEEAAAPAVRALDGRSCLTAAGSSSGRGRFICWRHRRLEGIQSLHAKTDEGPQRPREWARGGPLVRADGSKWLHMRGGRPARRCVCVCARVYVCALSLFCHRSAPPNCYQRP